MKIDPKPGRDSVFTRRAILIDAAGLEDADDRALQHLLWLARFYLLVLAGNAGRCRLEEAGVRYAAVRGDDVGELLRSRKVEPHASWCLGEGPPLGFRGVLPCGTPEEIRRSLRRIRSFESRSRIIIDDQRLKDVADSARRAGAKIVFTNGVFDLLHVGHLRLLENAKALGDVLIVAINSDDSTKRIKGETRPIVPQFSRAEILSRLREVDFCFIFTENDPKRILSIVGRTCWPRDANTP